MAEERARPRHLAAAHRSAARLLAGTLHLAVVLLALGAASCSSFRELYPKVDALAASGQYDQAAALISKFKDEYGARNAVLYHLDMGTMLHYAGKWKESNDHFAAAEQRMDELYTESITGNVGAFIVNDNTLPYRGEDFEQVIVDLYQALNWIQLGNLENALVFSRKVDQKLDFINRQYDVDKKNVYKEDAFARLLTGTLWEASGGTEGLNNAYISYNTAWGVYDQDFSRNYQVRAPAVLGPDLLTTAMFMGSDELALAKRRYANIDPMSPQDIRAKYGQLFVVHYAGRSPVKVESGFQGTYGTLYVKVVFPEYRRVPYTITGSQVLMDGRIADRLDPADPIGSIAITNLQNREARIKTKAIARAGAKLAANLALQKAARDKGGDAAGLFAAVLGGVATAATEQADLRCWQTLPDRILFGRVLMPPGKHHIAAQLLTGSGAVAATKDFGEMEVPPGQVKFILLQSNR